MNKINYFALGILCTVLLGGMFSFASAKWPWSSDAQLAPSRALVNAHECRADGKCDMIDAIVSGNIHVFSSFTSLGQSYFNNKTIVNGGPFVVNGIYLNNNNFEISPDEGKLNINYLAIQNRSAYLCIDQTGRVYASIAPCTID